MSAACAPPPTLRLLHDLVEIEHLEHSGVGHLGMTVLWESEAHGRITMLVRVLAKSPHVADDVEVGAVYFVKPYRDQRVGTRRFMSARDLEARYEGYDR